MQIKNKAYYLKTKLLSIKTKETMRLDLGRPGQKDLKKIENFRGPSETEASDFLPTNSEQVSDNMRIRMTKYG